MTAWTYKLNLNSGRTTIIQHVLDLQDFIETLIDKTDKLSYHFTAKHQANIKVHTWKNQKGNLSHNEGIILSDFAENYSFLVQDTAQGYHWDNSQATLHPFVVCYKDSEGCLQHFNICIISDLN